MDFRKSFAHSEELLQAALQEFYAQGYEQASINTILQKAGMSKGQFYYHFGHKEGLYLALIGVLIRRKREFLDAVMQPGDFEQDIFTLFKTQIQYGIAFARQYPLIDQFSQRFLKEKGSAIYHKALATYNFQEDDWFNELIDRAYERGQLRTELPRAFVKRTIGYLFTHAADVTGMTNGEDALENLNYLVDFMKAGLANPEPQPAGETK